MEPVNRITTFDVKDNTTVATVISRFEPEGQIISVKVDHSLPNGYRITIEQGPPPPIKFSPRDPTVNSPVKPRIPSLVTKQPVRRSRPQRQLDSNRITFVADRRNNLYTCCQYFGMYGEMEYITLTAPNQDQTKRGFAQFYTSEAAQQAIQHSHRNWQCQLAKQRLLKIGDEDPQVLHPRCGKNIHVSCLHDHENCCATMISADINMRRYTPLLPTP